MSFGCFGTLLHTKLAAPKEYLREHLVHVFIYFSTGPIGPLYLFKKNNQEGEKRLQKVANKKVITGQSEQQESDGTWRTSTIIYTLII